jgi:hypothetical protein
VIYFSQLLWHALFFFDQLCLSHTEYFQIKFSGIKICSTEIPNIEYEIAKIIALTQFALQDLF